MATFQHFEDIEAWQKARSLTKQIYEATSEARFQRDYALRDQIRRSAVSVMANIAEGFERDGNAEFRHFLSIAKGSSGELRTLLIVACDAEFLPQHLYEDLHDQVLTITRQIHGLMRYLRTSNRRGPKFD